MKHSPALAALIESLRALPGVGPKSAQRMAFHLLQSDRQAAGTLSRALDAALQFVGLCQRCRMLTEGTLCVICANPQRDASLVCVVESPADVVAIEQSGGYRGHYFVLMGHLSPLDGIGPEQLGAREFEALLDADRVREVILATNPTVEGEATAHFCPSSCVPAASPQAVLRTVFRSAASSSTSMAAPSPMPWRGATPYPEACLSRSQRRRSRR